MLHCTRLPISIHSNTFLFIVNGADFFVISSFFTFRLAKKAKGSLLWSQSVRSFSSRFVTSPMQSICTSSFNRSTLLTTVPSFPSQVSTGSTCVQDFQSIGTMSRVRRSFPIRGRDLSHGPWCLTYPTPTTHIVLFHSFRPSYP